VLKAHLNSLKAWAHLSVLAPKKSWSLVCDVDGVLTDGKFGYSDQGKLLKTFGSHDAEALKGSPFHSSVSFISADERGFEISAKRIKDMGYNVSLVSSRERADFIRSIQIESNVAFIGDSFSDIPAMRVADISAAPRNAYPSARRAANIRLTLNGGEGALAEFVHLLEKFVPLGKEPYDL
jgi:3-deoxy-D-manno-octulosonate 8-phosphate phosphatase (KDO 8-P phosphatase)